MKIHIFRRLEWAQSPMDSDTNFSELLYRIHVEMKMQKQLQHIITNESHKVQLQTPISISMHTSEVTERLWLQTPSNQAS